MLTENGVTILKFFLHVSREEQRQRLQSRLVDPRKNWKFELEDLKERELWDDYTEAYEDVLSKCGTDWTPWHLVPADRKRSRDLMIAEVAVATRAARDFTSSCRWDR